METRFELRIYRDRMVLSDGKTGQQLDRRASMPFSSTRLLVADTDAAGELLKTMIREMAGHARWLSWPSAMMVPMDLCEGGLSAVELGALRTLGGEAGFRKILVHEAGHQPFALA
ncbi:hypothetical protein HZY97_11195 [Sphingomonas sp. R-74633]|uniref:hypothetical protein n=1 Tax=Sphingomonas sp. R-74633 TaxID=2751188 RepID=UPI0015D24FCB|nr:hypothetical protein [Sphingomonas sp. R-74633]NYT41326.1 hypothetical protein [Sphingomonas sp. R-74633]